MQNPLVVFRVGYMETYDGPDEITGGGSWIKEHRSGGEMWNFLPEAGRYYGYVMTRGSGGLNLKRLGPVGRSWKSNDELGGVDIVFIARKPHGHQVVTGWYRNATVFHRIYRKRPDPDSKSDQLDYLCEAAVEDAVLLPPDKRTFQLPYAPTDGYGPGQSNVWYADSSDAKTKLLISSLRQYIGDGRTRNLSRRHNTTNSGAKGWPKPLPKDTILAIERASMDATRRRFAARYVLKDVCKDNRGWDISAKPKGRGAELQLEVKGHLGDVVQFELTPNEFEKLQANSKTYRVCVVRRALESQVVEVFSPILSTREEWLLKSENGNATIRLSRRVAARASQIA